jgi:intracellular septation protein A
MKLSLSLLWRIVVLQLAFNLLAFILLRNTPLLLDIKFIQWKAPLIYLGFAILLLCFQAIKKQSLVYVIFGYRLKLADIFWKKLTYALAGYCLVVACADTLVALVASFETWNQFKLFAPMAAFVVLVFTFPRLSGASNA